MELLLECGGTVPRAARVVCTNPVGRLVKVITCFWLRARRVYFLPLWVVQTDPAGRQCSRCLMAKACTSSRECRLYRARATVIQNRNLSLHGCDPLPRVSSLSFPRDAHSGSQDVTE